MRLLSRRWARWTTERCPRGAGPDGAVLPPELVRSAGARLALCIGASREARGWASSRAVVGTLVGSELRLPLAPCPGVDVAAGRRHVEPLERALASRRLHRTPRRRGLRLHCSKPGRDPARGEERDRPEVGGCVSCPRPAYAQLRRCSANGKRACRDGRVADLCLAEGIDGAGTDKI